MLYVYSDEQKEIHVLNRYAAAVWNNLAEPKGVEELIEALGREFADLDGSLESDVPGLLTELQDKRLLRVVPCE